VGSKRYAVYAFECEEITEDFVNEQFTQTDSARWPNLETRQRSVTLVGCNQNEDFSRKDAKAQRLITIRGPSLRRCAAA